MDEKATIIFDNMRGRRVSRAFTGEPVSDEALWHLAQAGRWAASGGNLRPHRFLITRDPTRISQIHAFSPGMLAEPPAIIAILLDHEQLDQQWVSIDPSTIPYIDVGTAAQNILLMAHALGIGACPVTSFSQAGVGGVLGLPGHLTVELLVMLGHPREVDRGVAAGAQKAAQTRDLTFWEYAGDHERTPVSS